MRTRTWLVVAVAAVVFAGSVVGLAVSAAGPPEPDPSQASLSVNVYAVPEVMTAVYKAYGGQFSDRWLARTVITNTGEVPVRNFQITYKVPGYCTTTSVEDYPIILPGQTVRDYCWPAFDSKKMAAIASETPAEVIVSYTYDGLEHPRETSEKFTFLGYNDFIHTYLPDADCLTFADLHDNADMLAAFVTARDPDVQKWAKTIAGGFSTGSDDGTMEALSRIYYTLRDWPFEYVSEPLTFWSREFAQHIQFPSETIANEGGNCVDLSCLFAAMLEAVGVKTYLMLSQGHCQFAVVMPESGDIIPVEETLVGTEATLQDAMDMAYQTYEEQMPEGTYLFIDVEEQWDEGMVPSW
jgi:transglutaminase-like putative cysteine protease